MKSLKYGTWLIAIGIAGCSSSNDDRAEAIEQDQSGSIKGTYTVPVSDPALEAAARFPVSVKMKTLSNGDVRLHYTLPAELVGTPQDVDLTGPPGGTLQGPAGTGVCTTTGATTTCKEHLPGMLVDVAAAKLANAGSGTAAQQAARDAVARTFSIDPIGIVSFSSSTDVATLPRDEATGGRRRGGR